MINRYYLKETGKLSYYHRQKWDARDGNGYNARFLSKIPIWREIIDKQIENSVLYYHLHVIILNINHCEFKNRDINIKIQYFLSKYHN